MARERRTKKEIIAAKIEMINEKVAGYEQKIEELNTERSELQAEFENITSAEKKAADEAQMKEVLKLIKSKNLSVEELKELVENR